MTEALGMAGRRARKLAHDRIQARVAPRSLAPAPCPLPDRPLPLVQRAEESPPSGAESASAPPTGPAESGVTNERETKPLTPEEVADRVYQLMRQDLRWDRERSGR